MSPLELVKLSSTHLIKLIFQYQSQKETLLGLATSQTVLLNLRSIALTYL